MNKLLDERTILKKETEELNLHINEYSVEELSDRFARQSAQHTDLTNRIKDHKINLQSMEKEDRFLT